MNGDDLMRSLANRADAGFEITAGMCGLAFNIHHRKHATLAPRHHIAGRSARFAIEDHPRAACLIFNDRAAFGATDFLIASEKPNQGPGCAAEFMERGEDKHIHHNAGLHIGHTWPIGDIALNGERPAFRFSLGKNRVPMPHQHDVLLLIAGSNFMRTWHNAA